MRITLNSSMNSYQTNLNSIRSRYAKEQQRLTTQKNIQTPSDSPHDFSEIKRLSNTISQNERYRKNIEDGRTDVDIYEGTLQNFTDTLVRAKDIVNDAVNPANFDKASVLGNNLRNVLDDLVKIANYEYDGRFAFAGTLTTRSSITPVAPATSNLPFEIVKDPGLASTSNPEGLNVVFKGNNEDRLVATSSNSTERISVRAKDTFGTGGTSTLQNIVDIYNLLAYKQDGTARTPSDGLATDEARSLQDKLKQLADSVDVVNSEVGRLGGVANRMDALNDQITYENTRLRELRSGREDADIPETILKLRREETALQATLQIGPDIIQRSLLDFLK